MATAVTLTEAEGYAKERYGEIERAIPSFAVLQDRIKFSSAKRVGDSYHWPVQVKRSHGITFAPSSGSSLATLNDPASLEFKDATLTPIDLVLQEDLGYASLSRMREQGEAAFGSMLDEVALSLREAASFYVETALLYGQDNIGVISSETYDNNDTSYTITFTDASWAPGLWAQSEGMFIEIWEAAFASQRTNSANETHRVTAVDPDTKTITVAVSDNSHTLGIVATDLVVPRGWRSGSTWQVGAGLAAICNASSYAGLTYASYGQFKPNTKSFSGRCSMGKIHQLVNKQVVRGLTGDVTVLVPTYSWVDMMNDLAGLRQYGSDTRKEMQLGTNSLVFHGVNGGKMEIVPHSMVKAGEIITFQADKLRRIGSTDVVFRLPGGNENFFMDLESKAACRLRCYADQTLLCTSPRTLGYGSGFDPDSD